MTGKRMNLQTHPGQTPAERVAALLPREGQGDGHNLMDGVLTGFRQYLPYAPFAKPYVYGEPRAKWAVDHAGAPPHDDVYVARARRAAGGPVWPAAGMTVLPQCSPYAGEEEEAAA